MKKIILFIALLSFLGACTDVATPDIGGNITDVTDQIASIDKQIENIQTTIDLLKETDKELRAAIEELKKTGVAPEAVKVIETKLEDLEKKIKEIEEDIKGTKDWASATFAILEQYKELSETLAELTEAIKHLPENGVGDKSDFTKMIEECTFSMQTWVNEKLTGYYTLAEAEAALESLRTSIADGDKALLEEIAVLEKELDEMEARLTEAYKKAIEEALKNDGNIPPSADPDDTNKELEPLIADINVKIIALESRILGIEGKLEEIVDMVQSVSDAYNFSSGLDVEFIAKSSPYDNSGTKRFTYYISPRRLVNVLAQNFKETLSFQLFEHKHELTGSPTVYKDQGGDWIEYSQYREIPVNFQEIPIKSCTADSRLGTLTIEIDLEDIPEEIFLKNEVKVSSWHSVLSISYGSTEIQSDQRWLYFGYDNLEEFYIERYDSSGAYIYENDSDLNGHLEDGVIAMYTSFDRFTNMEHWITPVLNESNNKVVVSIAANDAPFNRVAWVYFITSQMVIKTQYTQWWNSWEFTNDKSELSFSYEGDNERVRFYHSGYESLKIKSHDYDWINASVITEEGYGYSDVMIEVSGQKEFTDSDIREAVITVTDGYHSSDIKVSQKLLTIDDIRITADREEVNFKWEGGTERINLTHPADADIRVKWEDGGMEEEEGGIYVEWDIESINETTSILTIYKGSNHRPETIEGKICLKIGVFDDDSEGGNAITPVTEIRITQEAVPLEEFIITADRKEVGFQWNGGTEEVVLTHPADADIRVEYGDGEFHARWDIEPVNETTSILRLDVSEPNREAHTKESIVYLSLQGEYYFDIELPTTEIRLTQHAISEEEATVSANEKEVHFTYEGGTRTITLTHPADAELEIRSDIFEVWSYSINATTSSLEIFAKSNHYEEPLNERIEISLRDFDWEVPITTITVTQDAVPVE